MNFLLSRKFKRARNSIAFALTKLRYIPHLIGCIIIVCSGEGGGVGFKQNFQYAALASG